MEVFWLSQHWVILVPRTLTIFKSQGAITRSTNLSSAHFVSLTLSLCTSRSQLLKLVLTFHQITDKNELALVYAFLDAVGTVIVIIGFYWLKMFEQSEVNHLNITTVTASDYTLRVSRVPVNATEREIAAHHHPSQK